MIFRQDPILYRLSQDITLPPAPAITQDVYLTLLEAVISQQLSVKAADTIFGRVKGLFPNEYPSPDLVLAMADEPLRAAGLSGQKTRYVKNIADFALNNDLSPQALAPLSDEEIIAELTQIKGVGRWTVEMLLMFGLARPDVFPAADLGIQQGMVRLYQLSESGKELLKRMYEIAEVWRPHRTLACRYIWRWKDQKSQQQL